MTVPRVNLDTNVFITAMEQAGARSDHAWWVLSSLEEGEFVGVTSELTLSEVLVKPLERGADAVVEAYQGMIAPSVGFDVLPVDRAVLVVAARLRAGRASLKLPDAIHVATAQLGGCGFFVSADERIAVPTGMARLPLSPFTVDDIVNPK
ncbi:type II toxin-antitoxin system VapC family toxin [Xanthobacter wiegelii]|uniref:type II toxin-antitoxin system VapC family toxin n=1 Tax=Xanthobacter wiegelii TaxID=3119913 RepID=UPI00372BCD5B